VLVATSETSSSGSVYFDAIDWGAKLSPLNPDEEAWAPAAATTVAKKLLVVQGYLTYKKPQPIRTLP